MFEIFNIIIKEDNIFQLQEITVVTQASVPGASNLISRNEEILVEARRSYYEEVKQKKLNEKNLKFGQYCGNDYFWIWII